jgi:hypothetical protein
MTPTSAVPSTPGAGPLGGGHPDRGGRPGDRVGPGDQQRAHDGDQFLAGRVKAERRGQGSSGGLAAPVDEAGPRGPARARRAPGRPHPAHPMHPGRPRRGRFALRTYTQQRRAPPWSPRIPAAAAQLRWPTHTIRGRRAPSVTDAHLATPRRAGHVDVAHRASCATSTQGARRRRQVIHRSMTRHPSTPTSTTDAAPEHTDVHHLPPPTSTTTPARLGRTSRRPAARDG